MAEKVIVSTEKAPVPYQGSPYSQAVRVGELLFCSGQTGIDPATGTLVPGGIEAETEQTLRNLDAVLAAAGAGLANAVKSSVFLLDIADFAAMNGVYRRFMGTEPPARSTVQVAALPAGALIEIEIVAHV